MAHQYPVTEYSLFGGSDSEGDGIILPEKDQDWNPNQAPPVPPDYPLSDDESPIITLKKKKGKSKGHRANNTAFKSTCRKILLVFFFFLFGHLVTFVLDS